MMQPSPDQEGYALVCGLSDSESYLSLRSGPSTSSPEIIKLNNFMLVHMTGEFSEDNKWSAIDYFLVAADSDGREWREFSQMPIELYGFVSTKYLCDFYDHPEN
ncbi:SH3 domain-containing protein [Celeribacter ethanolicus]|uniref:SH3 domain-containing protein n=1 Tax=Celeribacter ethanolicus TaxID=1758178 RepID=UPI0012FD232F|nr:SH3 domain-containing protein [Celeribacter ethanolicus]